MSDRSGGSLLSEPPSAQVLGIVAAAFALIAIIVVLVIVLNRPETGDPGRLSETGVALPSDIALPVLHDATTEWGLGNLGLQIAADQMAGGVAVGDLDGDRFDELIVANGNVAVLRWNGSGYDDPHMLDGVDAIGVTATDVDGDGFDDALIATAGDVDRIVWGGPWVADGSSPSVTELPAVGQSGGLLAGELTGDDLIDIVRLGRGRGDPVPDLLWRATGPRSFDEVELPLPDRFSLAGELVDADGDGLLDIWLTRDVGWARGGDSVLSRQGDPLGEWVDAAPDLGVDLEIDGMGITIADLNGDAVIDAYVSDLGDNEQLLGSAGGFESISETGAAHIRPIGAPDHVVSSTWGTGAVDINLDGILDLVLASGGFPGGSVPNKIDGSEVAVAEPPAVLLGRGDGTFADAWPMLGIELDVVGRGLTIADFDGDGDDDIVLVDRRGNVHGLRNDTTGPTISVFMNPGCGGTAGHAVTVETDRGVFQRLLAPHGYASSHGSEVIVGNPSGGPVTAEISGVSAQASEQPPSDLASRPRLSFECP
jgi:hypothetical protein